MDSSDRPDRVSEEREAGIIERARDLLSCSPYSELGRITSSYHHGVLMLRGCVTSQYLKQVAQELVGRIEGVKALVNQIEVRMAAERGPSRAVVPGPGPDGGPIAAGRRHGDSTRGG
jgi:osmotically-inducible protein OsmY